MSEYIGKVKLNDDDYPGTDLYTDGAVEDELLAIAQNERPEDFARVVSERRSWPVMYHFSPVRGNILSWYPIKKTDRVLEIGSGCGAMTDVLAERAASVTCVDLSKKRSLVNANRNKGCANLEILLGNFQDVEKHLPNDYDIITLIGVFEYGKCYIASDTPYVDFLKIVGRHLAPGGRILIAIENRMGMKYLAGCSEDHTGRYFDGLENYPATDYVRTFTRPELERIFDEAGFPTREFRYPYPDYKFALSIYSDSFLPKPGDLRNNMVNYDRRRLVLFDEAKAYDALLTAGEFPLFSNSYFITLSRENAPAANITPPGSPASEAEPEPAAPIFVKFSNDRGASHSIRTEIAGEGTYRVRKVPVTPSARAHVRNICESGRKLETVFAGTRFTPNRCIMDGEAVAFEYLTGRTLEEHFAELKKTGKDALLAGFTEFFRELDKTANSEFRRTSLFAEVFGNVYDEEGAPAPEVSDIDLIPANIILIEGRWHVIDYEWTFPCPVPIDYIKWRVVHYYCAGRSADNDITEAELIRAAGIKNTDLDTFARMEQNFQAWAAKGAEPLWKIYPDVTPGSISLEELLGGASSTAKGSVTLYFDRGTGFSESDTARIPIGEDGSVEFQADLEGVRSVRIDPTELPVTAKIDYLEIDGRPVRSGSIFSNGFTTDSKTYVFGENDPQLIVTGIIADARILKGKLELSAGSAALREATCRMLKEKDRTINRLKKEVESAELTLARVLEGVRAIENTKAVRIWRATRDKFKKSDPFAILRPELRNGEGIHVSLDRRAYQPEGIRLLGWVYDEAFEGEKLSIVNALGHRVPAEIERNFRQDVNDALHLPADREAGFRILIAFSELRDLPLCIRVENPRGVLTIPLDIEPDPDKRRLHHEQVKAGQLPYDGPVVPEYDDWAMDHLETPEDLAHQRFKTFPYEPLISVVIPLYNTPERYLAELLESFTHQTYRKFELCLADGSPDEALKMFLDREYAHESRIRYEKLPENLGISGNTNAALRMAAGDVIMLCDHDDVLEPSALYHVVRAFYAAENVDAVYSDEDKVTAEGHFLYDPNFKPDYSPDFLASSNYICHLFAFRRELLAEVGEFRSEFDGAQDHDFIFRCCERARSVRHIRRVLYHWRAHPDSTAGRPESKLYAYENGRKAVEEHWKRLGIPATVTHDTHYGHYRSSLQVTGEPLVSILIPNRDQAKLLRRAVSSILRKTLYRNYEIIILENGSTEAETFALYNEYTRCDQIDIITWNEEFNFSKINNFGAKAARGEYLVFLNNDIEVTDGTWLQEMLGYCQRRDVGAVGTLLYYPNGMIQHAGVILGLGGPAGHIFGGMDPADYPGGGRALSTQNVSAVTAACLMTKKSIFNKVEGLHEGYAVAFGDVDYCLKVRHERLLVIELATTSLIHHESASRGSDAADADLVKHARFLQEAALLRKRWRHEYPDGDPYYNPNLTLERPDYSLR